MSCNKNAIRSPIALCKFFFPTTNVANMTHKIHARSIGGQTLHSTNKSGFLWNKWNIDQKAVLWRATKSTTKWHTTFCLTKQTQCLLWVTCVRNTSWCEILNFSIQNSEETGITWTRDDQQEKRAPSKSASARNWTSSCCRGRSHVLDPTAIQRQGECTWAGITLDFCRRDCFCQDNWITLLTWHTWKGGFTRDTWNLSRIK